MKHTIGEINRRIGPSLMLVVILIGLGITFGDGNAAPNQYVVLAWNDLGMHCINKSFSQIAILPPFNNLWVQVILRGEPPQVVTSGITVEYSIANNTRVQGKTDFWQYVKQLFGVDLKEGIGLTGNGLSGKMKLVGDHFEATGIPVLPYDDKMNWNPYQTAVIKVRSTSGRIIFQSPVQITVPVSDELNCAKCHAQGMDGTVNLPGGGDPNSVEANILAVHDYYHGLNGVSDQGPNLSDTKPVLCASCHSSNALGAPGNVGIRSLSEAMHGWHNRTRSPDVGCYDCHPGAVTQCTRTALGGMGYMGTTPSCPTCHGYTEDIAASIAGGRQPWLQEPSCEQCHGKNYSTGQDLYRKSKGHGNVYCTACHNSPHAWWPSKLWQDNLLPITLQKNPVAVGDCSICHSNQRQMGNNPHVTYYLPLP